MPSLYLPIFFAFRTESFWQRVASYVVAIVISVPAVTMAKAPIAAMAHQIQMFPIFLAVVLTLLSPDFLERLKIKWAYRLQPKPSSIKLQHL